MRDAKNLADWIDLDYSKRPRRFRRVFRWTCWTILAVATAAIAWSLLPGQQQLYQAGPLTTVHAMYLNDCQVCHTQSFQTAQRLIDPDARAVPDSACSKCHSGHVHHDIQAHHVNCVHCHREHRGDHDLTRVPQQLCLDCHRDLKHGVKPGSTTHFLDVKDWLNHPEFRGHGKGGDPGTIRFNHHKHLQAEGVPVLDKQQSDLQWGKNESERRTVQRRVLQCSDCHETDDAGRFMRPINFEKHCGECHPLSVQVGQTTSTQETMAAVRAFAQKSAPHEPPDIIRGVVRERLTRLVQGHPDLLEGQPAKLPRPIPGNANHTRPVTEKEFAWVNDQLHMIEIAMFQQAGWCRYCHTPADANADANTPEFLPSQINTRMFRKHDKGEHRWREHEQWFPHSQFNHDTHRMMECTSCHKGIRESKATADLHMPAISTCRQCHTGTVGASARSDCAECHTYHPR